MSATAASVKTVNSAAAAPALQISVNPLPNKAVKVALPPIQGASHAFPTMAWDKKHKEIVTALEEGSGASALSWGDRETLRHLLNLPKNRFDHFIQQRSVVLGAKDSHTQETISSVVDELEDLPAHRSCPLERLKVLYTEMLTQDRQKPLTAFEKSVVLEHLISTLKAEVHQKAHD
jgi:hypothetical protein